MKNESGALFENGVPSEAVAKKFPALYRAILRGLEWRERWEKVHGNVDAQHKLVRKEYGLNEPMSEEAKAKLKAYMEEHKEEIKQRRKLKQRQLSALKGEIKASIKLLQRKRGR